MICLVEYSAALPTMWHVVRLSAQAWFHLCTKGAADSFRVIQLPESFISCITAIAVPYSLVTLG